MATENTVWVVFSCDAVTDKLRSWLDTGHFEEAIKYSQSIKDYNDKLKAFAQSKGGHLMVALDDRQIMELPASAADEIPYFIEGFKEDLGQHKIGVGIGLDFDEAVRAMRHSLQTGEIELYTPGETPIFKANEITDATDAFGLNVDPAGLKDEMLLPPNIFDPQFPPKEAQKFPPTKDRPFVSRPEMQKELQAEGEMLQGIGQQMQPPQPQQPQGAPGQPGQPQPQDLMEALNGGPIPGRQPTPPQGAAEGESDKKPKEGDEGEGKEGGDEGAEKLYGALANIQQKIPQLMELHAKNPDAFKQSMDLINKLMKLTQTKKSEKLVAKLDELEKAFTTGIHRNWPVGTVIGRKKKVMVGGKAAWRSVISGQVRDASDNPISVKSHNLQAQGNPLTTQKEEKTPAPAPKQWMVKVKGNSTWYPMTHMEDRGVHGNFYHLEGVGPVHQGQVEDVRIPGEKLPDVSK